MSTMRHHTRRTVRTGPVSLRAPHEPDDADLIASVRAGNVCAYDTLFKRHRASANNLARQLAPGSRVAQDDLVAEASTQVLEVLLAGNGPASTFRAYLLTTLRHIAYDRSRRIRRLEFVGDISSTVDMRPGAMRLMLGDPAAAMCVCTLILRAFAQLPRRWRWILWHTEVEGYSTSEIAPILNLTPNGTSALAHRAREGRKRAYAQVDTAESSVTHRRTSTGRLGACRKRAAWTRDQRT
jgi:DNA-directed RNA polymerase specialized sigma24 family protein